VKNVTESCQVKLQVDYQEIRDLVRRQLTNFFGYDPNKDDDVLEQALQAAIKRCEKCFAAVSNKYCHRDGQPYFNPFHSGQYTIFLYYLSNSVWLMNPENRSLADRLYYLNKTLNCLDLYYEVILPEIFFLDHAVGSVMGRGTYGNYFAFSQNCTVGNNKGVYPQFGEYVLLMSGAKVLGKSVIGDQVIISANCYVKDEDIPSQSIVFGESPSLIIKKKDVQSIFEVVQQWFYIPGESSRRKPINC
jgi:serine O-acetyltransferase